MDQAERQLAEYIAAKHEPFTKSTRPDQIDLADVVMIYLDNKLPCAKRPKELISLCERLVTYWGMMKVNEVKGASCRNFVAWSTTPSMARRDLEILRAAMHHYDKEFGLDHIPPVTLPPRGKPREGHLTRSQAAKLVHAAYRAGNRHLARYILIGLYTGTRSGAICAMQWLPNLEGGYFDLDRGVMHRAPAGDANASKKRRPPAAIPAQLMAHLKRWRRMDSVGDAGLRFVIHWNGNRVLRVKRAFNAAVSAADLSDWVIPHCLRHTAITWAMQDGKNINIVAEFFGITVEELQKTYWHHHPDYQHEMRAHRRRDKRGPRDRYE